MVVVQCGRQYGQDIEMRMQNSNRLGINEYYKTYIFINAQFDIQKRHDVQKNTCLKCVCTYFLHEKKYTQYSYIYYILVEILLYL